jgi:serine/threonine-protein kinase SRPK3
MERIDEESLSDYDPKSYYPVQSNDTVGGIFRAKVKLGYGRTSTTWLCTDDQYVPSDVHGSN